MFQCLSLSCLYSPARVSTIIYKTINQKWSVRKGYHNAQIGSNVMSVSVQNLDQNKTHKAEVNVTGAITVVLPTNVTGVRYITLLSLTSSLSSSSDTILNNYSWNKLLMFCRWKKSDIAHFGISMRGLICNRSIHFTDLHTACIYSFLRLFKGNFG